MNLDRFGGRKFLISASAGTACSVLVWFGKIDPSTFRDVVLGVVGVYVASNVWQRVKTDPAANPDG